MTDSLATVRPQVRDARTKGALAAIFGKRGGEVPSAPSWHSPWVWPAKTSPSCRWRSASAVALMRGAVPGRRSASCPVADRDHAAHLERSPSECAISCWSSRHRSRSYCADWKRRVIHPRAWIVLAAVWSPLVVGVALAHWPPVSVWLRPTALLGARCSRSGPGRAGVAGPEGTPAMAGRHHAWRAARSPFPDWWSSASSSSCRSRQSWIASRTCREHCEERRPLRRSGSRTTG